MKENTKVKIAYFYSIVGDGINSGKLPDSEDIWARSFRKGSKKKKKKKKACLGKRTFGSITQILTEKLKKPLLLHFL